MFYGNKIFRKRREGHCDKFEIEVMQLYSSILQYDENINTVYLRSESTHDLSRSHIHPPEFGLKWLG